MRTNAHRQLLPASPGDSVPSPAQCGPLSAISYLSSPARLTPRPGTTGSTVSRYEDSPDWTYEDFERQVIKNLNLTLAARPWTDASYRSPRQYAVAKTWGVDGSTSLLPNRVASWSKQPVEASRASRSRQPVQPQVHPKSSQNWCWEGS